MNKLCAGLGVWLGIPLIFIGMVVGLVAYHAHELGFCWFGLGVLVVGVVITLETRSGDPHM